MTDVTEATTATQHPVTPERAPAEPNLLVVAGIALLTGAGVAGAGYAGAAPLLVAVATVQALLAFGWVFGTGMPGRRGALMVAAGAAAGADVAASLYPEGRLGVLGVVLGLAIPAAFVHQLLRGAARTQLVSSLSAVAVLVVAEVSVAALLQLRHELASTATAGPSLAGKVAAAVAAAAFAAVVTGALMDVVVTVPRFDPAVARGVPGLLVAAAVGAAVGHLVLRDSVGFAADRSVFVGGAVGALAGLLAIACAFVAHTTPRGASRLARAGRPLYAALLPMCVVAPAAFLLCLAIRA